MTLPVTQSDAEYLRHWAFRHKGLGYIDSANEHAAAHRLVKRELKGSGK